MKFDSYTRFLKSYLYQECMLAEVEGRPLPDPYQVPSSPTSKHSTSSDRSNLSTPKKVTQTHLCLLYILCPSFEWWQSVVSWHNDFLWNIITKSNKLWSTLKNDTPSYLSVEGLVTPLVVYVHSYVIMYEHLSIMNLWPL